MIPNPGYPTYQSAAKLAGGHCGNYDLKEENDWLPDFEELKDLLKTKRDGQDTVLMFVNYPQMPTGQLPTRKLFEQLIRFAHENHILLVHDNPYSFILNEEPMSILQVDGAMDHAIELNSLSKSHNMAGWRVGMLMGRAGHIENVLRFKSNMDSGMFLPLQLAAAKALSLPSSWYESVNIIYRRRKSIVVNMLEGMGCRFSNKQAGLFIWARIPDGITDGYAMSDLLLYKANVFITPGGIFGSAGNNYIRVSLCSPEEKILECLERIRLAGFIKPIQHV
jgi:aspartate/methionine/tyrosine aminotransferase